MDLSLFFFVDLPFKGGKKLLLCVHYNRTVPGKRFTHALDSQRLEIYNLSIIAGWSSLVARWAHNPKVGGSNPSPATKAFINSHREGGFFIGLRVNPHFSQSFCWGGASGHDGCISLPVRTALQSRPGRVRRPAPHVARLVSTPICDASLRNLVRNAD